MIDLPHDLSSDNYSGGVAADLAQIRAKSGRCCNRYGSDTTAAKQQHNPVRSTSLRLTGGYCITVVMPGIRKPVRPYELYDAQTMRAITGSDYYSGGLYTPGTVIIFVRGVAQGLKSGRSRFMRSPVTGLERQGQDWIVKTPEEVAAPAVILAVNGHVESFGFFQRRLMHVFTYASDPCLER